MEKENKSTKIAMCIALAVIIIILVIALVSSINKRDNNTITNETTQVEDVNQSQNTTTTDNESEIAPQDIKDEEPASTVQTPSDAETDEVTGSNPTE